MQNNHVVENIIDSFDTWKFKREQPFNYEKLKEIVSVAVLKSEPIKFITYWGKGGKDDSGEPEKQTLKFLNEFFNRIRNIYPSGIELTILFTDTHAELNGHSKESTRKYFASMDQLAKAYSFKTTNLSEFIGYDRERLLSTIDSVSIENKLLNILVGSAEKHYCVSKDYELGAKLYYLQNQLEKERIDEKYKDYVFLTFNGSKINGLFPKNLPIFYMYSMKKGQSIKPWFKKESHDIRRTSKFYIGKTIKKITFILFVFITPLILAVPFPPPPWNHEDFLVDLQKGQPTEIKDFPIVTNVNAIGSSLLSRLLSIDTESMSGYVCIKNNSEAFFDGQKLDPRNFLDGKDGGAISIPLIYNETSSKLYVPFASTTCEYFRRDKKARATLQNTVEVRGIMPFGRPEIKTENGITTVKIWQYANSEVIFKMEGVKGYVWEWPVYAQNAFLILFGWIITLSSIFQVWDKIRKK